MSGQTVCDIDTSPTHQPRQNRTRSIGLPARTSLLAEPPPSIPRRHSAAPMVTPPPIPLRPPVIPKRCKNEKPIPVIRSCDRSSSIDKPRQVSPLGVNFDASPAFSAWDPEPENGKLIDLNSSEKAPALDYSSRLAFDDFAAESSVFAAGFHQTRYGQSCGDSSGPSFDQLEKASRGLEKRLRDNIIKNNEQTLRTEYGERPIKWQERQSRAAQDNRGKVQRQCRGSEESGREDNASSQSRVFQNKEDQFEESSRKDEKTQTVLGNVEKSRQDTFQANGADETRHREKTPKFDELQRASYELEKRLQEQTPDPRRQRDIAGSERSRNAQQSSAKEGDKSGKVPKATQTNLPPPLSAVTQNTVSKPANVRQDSNISSDSFSQTSSPSYTSKTMEAPLLPQKHGNSKVLGRTVVTESKNPPSSPIIKSVSTPASLQAIVKFHSGSNMTLHNRIIKDIRRPSSHYVTKGRLRFRFAQIMINAVALMIITGGLAAYFKNYPENALRMINRTVYTEMIGKMSMESESSIIEPKNPSPGICLPVIVSFCQYHKIPYNFTIFPNYMGNLGQRDAQHELELYDTVVDVKCYELAALFLCTIFAPKCGSQGHVVPPCRSLCFQTMRRCGFFLEVFGLSLPDYLKCDLLIENKNPDVCVGHREVIEAAERADKPACTSGFQCDGNRCIPVDWHCDGHVDCEDKTDETNCGNCGNDIDISGWKNDSGKKSDVKNSLMPSTVHCGERICLSPEIICDGVVDCPWGQDERNCLRLSERNGDIGVGQLEVYRADINSFVPACIAHWDESTSAQSTCALLGYAAVNSSTLTIKDNNATFVESRLEIRQRWKSTKPNAKNLLKSFQACDEQSSHRTVDLVCNKYVCGRRRHSYGNSNIRTRIVGGIEATPGDWPFLAALLGGPEEVFYCAGVLISDQWVLTASHCVGNHSSVTGWTIQLGITRRNAHTYLGQKLKVKRVVSHPNYNLGVAHDNDVALFQLEHKVQFHDHLRPVCLPKANEEIKPQTVCTVIGWGKKNDTESSEYESAINEVEVPVLPRDICNSWLEHKDLNVTDGMICAGYAGGEKDACQGDSGGPLLCRDKDDREKWFVGGIVSWGIKCAYPKLPGVYAYVPKYVTWIEKEIARYSGEDTE